MDFVYVWVDGVPHSLAYSGKSHWAALRGPTQLTPDLAVLESLPWLWRLICVSYVLVEPLLLQANPR